MAESNADVYASFGVNNAVMTGSTPTEHEQNMLSLDVAARDGDDAIVLSEEPSSHNDDPYASGVDPFAGGEDDEGRIQVRISEDGSEAEFDTGSDNAEVETEGEAAEFEPLGDTPEELSQVTEQLGQHEEGFQAMVEQAVERGLSAESVTRIYEEYEADGISEKSYAELEAAGYSRAFVDSYISGQEALVDQYVNQVVAFAGGKERFSAIHTHLEATNPAAAESLETAMMNRDLATVKAIINLAGESYTKKFGKPANRSVTKRATPVKPVARQKEGFTNQAEMIKAMSDPRYRSDAAYRQMVEQKVIDSSF
jgi:hypothetical protein